MATTKEANLPSTEPSVEVETKDQTEWNPVHVNNLLAQQDFASLVSTSCLYRHFDVDRLLDVVDWTRQHGFVETNVPVLYMYIRNLIKWDIGRVLTEADFLHALESVVLLLLRTSQDAAVCQRLLAEEDSVKSVYMNLRLKMNNWLEKFKGKKWPTLRHVVNQLADSHRSVKTLPSPVWCTKCETAVLSRNTIYFGTPSPGHIRSAKEINSKVQTVRAEVAKKFFDWSKERTWAEFLKQDYTDSST